MFWVVGSYRYNTYKAVSKLFMNVEEYWRGITNRKIQRNWQHMVDKTKKSKAKTQHNMCWTPRWATKNTDSVKKTWALLQTTGSKGEANIFLGGNRIKCDLHYYWSDSEIVVILLIILLFKRSVVFLHFTYLYIVRIVTYSHQIKRKKNIPHISEQFWKPISKS